MKFGSFKMVMIRPSSLVLIFLILSAIQSTLGLSCYKCNDIDSYGSSTSCRDLKYHIPLLCMFDYQDAFVTKIGERGIMRDCVGLALNNETKGCKKQTHLTACTCTGDGCNGNEEKVRCYQCNSDSKTSSCETLKGISPISCIFPFMDSCVTYTEESNKGYKIKRSCFSTELLDKEYKNNCEKVSANGETVSLCHCTENGCNGKYGGNGSKKRGPNSTLIGAILGGAVLWSSFKGTFGLI